MSPSRTRARWIKRFLGGALAFTVIGTSDELTTIPARPTPLFGAQSGRFTIRGAGWGHGWGMSQYGAYGAARKGLSWKQILAFYYRGTQLSACPPEPRSRSGSPLTTTTACGSGRRRVSPCGHAGIATRCPQGRPTSRGESSRGTGYRLSYRNRPAAARDQVDGTDHRHLVVLDSVQDRQGRAADGSVRSYRGSVALIKRGSGGRTINKVLLEDYVKGVVPAEMPTSWASRRGTGTGVRGTLVRGPAA